MKTEEFWQNFVNQRKFLVSFAQQRGFDPLKPENWHEFLSTFKNRKDLVGGILLNIFYLIYKLCFQHYFTNIIF